MGDVETPKSIEKYSKDKQIPTQLPRISKRGRPSRFTLIIFQITDVFFEMFINRVTILWHYP